MALTLDRLPTPCATVDITVLERNLHAMAALASQGGKRLRPHLKTHKCIEIARRQRELGACAVTVAKLSEAEVFVEAGFEDVLIANLIVGDAKLDRLARLACKARVTVGVDSEAVLDGLMRSAARAPSPIGVYIEVDTGHHRTGVRRHATAARLASRCQAADGLDLRGVYTHEGHLYKSEPERLADTCLQVVDIMAEYARICDVETISVGSTPGARHMCKLADVSEIRPGNYVFHDATQVLLGAPRDACALTVLATVVATPTETDAFIDAGSKALSGDRDPGGRYGFVLDRPGIVVDWCSEEHGHLNLSAAPGALSIGDRVRIVPAHACTCVNCHDSLHILYGESWVDTWPVAARGRLT